MNLTVYTINELESLTVVNNIIVRWCVSFNFMQMLHIQTHLCSYHVLRMGFFFICFEYVKKRYNIEEFSAIQLRNFLLSKIVFLSKMSQGSYFISISFNI